MAKKPNINAAFSQSLTTEQKKHYEHCLVMSNDGLTYLFANEAGSVAIISPREVYKNFKDFDARVTQADLIKNYQVFFEKQPSEAILADEVELKVMIWMKLCGTANNRLSEKTPSGEKRTLKKLENRGYELITLMVKADLKLPPQAKTCLAFFGEQAAMVNHDDSMGIFTITEKAFKDYVIAQAERLKTRQDPWRIFQYYRPQLIQNGFIRLV